MSLSPQPTPGTSRPLSMSSDDFDLNSKPDPAPPLAGLTSTGSSLETPVTAGESPSLLPSVFTITPPTTLPRSKRDQDDCQMTDIHGDDASLVGTLSSAPLALTPGAPMKRSRTLDLSPTSTRSIPGSYEDLNDADNASSTSSASSTTTSTSSSESKDPFRVTTGPARPHLLVTPRNPDIRTVTFANEYDITGSSPAQKRPRIALARSLSTTSLPYQQQQLQQQQHQNTHFHNIISTDQHMAPLMEHTVSAPAMHHTLIPIPPHSAPPMQHTFMPFEQMKTPTPVSAGQQASFKLYPMSTTTLTSSEPMDKSLSEMPSYDAYIARQRREIGNDGSSIWSKDVEDAFMEAIRKIPKVGRRKITVNGRSCGRNELISDFIYRKTGRLRTRKQVSSHIQVLKHLLKDDPQFMNLVTDSPTPTPPANMPLLFTSPTGLNKAPMKTAPSMARSMSAPSHAFTPTNRGNLPPTMTPLSLPSGGRMDQQMAGLVKNELKTNSEQIAFSMLGPPGMFHPSPTPKSNPQGSISMAESPIAQHADIIMHPFMSPSTPSNAHQNNNGSLHQQADVHLDTQQQMAAMMESHANSILYATPTFGRIMSPSANFVRNQPLQQQQQQQHTGTNGHTTMMMDSASGGGHLGVYMDCDAALLEAGSGSSVYSTSELLDLWM
ncbi:TEA/ATTS domain family-domain-containing protein [Lipomyces oligophaga]|uniref:TEA/ATTS domain family-domain-containing protein n=1 Tax=Lipomyces oligophaga TaxID=45792 RepID=UPI0034CE337B